MLAFQVVTIKKQKLCNQDIHHFLPSSRHPSLSTNVSHVKPTTPATPQLPSSFTFSIASWNTLYTNSTSNITNGVNYTASKAVVIGYQEMKMAANRTPLKNTLLCSSCAYNGYVTDYTTNNWTSVALPIVWKRSDSTLVSSGNKVAAPSYDTSNKYFTWVRLRHNATHKEFYLVNAHPVYGAATDQGKPRQRSQSDL